MYKICQILTLSALASTSLLVAASLTQLIQFDLPLAYGLFAIAAALEICRGQYVMGTPSTSLKDHVRVATRSTEKAVLKQAA